jgi:hypothetical protein
VAADSQPWEIAMLLRLWKSLPDPLKDRLKSSVRRGLQRGPFRAVALHKYLSSIGWNLSEETRKSVDASGRPLPWLTYSAISFLADRVTAELDVFEYGMGNSTLWWADRVRTVTSCEHDVQWYEATRSRAPANADLTHIPLKDDGDYCRAALRSGRKYHIVVIDGRDRVNCAKQCLGALRPDAVVIWDNSERPKYQPGIDILRSSGFKEIFFDGLGPVNNYPWRTSIFYRPENCLGI